MTRLCRRMLPEPTSRASAQPSGRWSKRGGGRKRGVPAWARFAAHRAPACTSAASSRTPPKRACIAKHSGYLSSVHQAVPKNPRASPFMSRMRRLARRGSLLWILLLLAAGTTTASQWGGSRREHARAHADDQSVRGVGHTLALFRGIPQTGVTLGDPKAPVELIEFANLQCPYCAAVNTTLLPQILKHYVRPGRLKLVFRSLAFVGNGSAMAAAWQPQSDCRVTSGNSYTSHSRTRVPRTEAT